MALPAAPGSPATPSSLPVVGQRGVPGAPPPGPSGVTQPSANAGHQAAGLALVTQANRILERALGLLGSGTEPGQAVLKALTSLSKHVPPGSGSPGVENSALMQLMQQQKSENPMMQLLRSQGQQQAPAGAAQ